MTVVLSMLALMTAPAEAEAQRAEYVPRFPFCNTRACDRRAVQRRHRRKVQARHKALVRWERHAAKMRKVVAPHEAHLNSMARCESGGRWHLATGNGFYGGLQFTMRSWFAVGGQGMPHLASPLQQKYRAVLLSRAQGWGAWPNCA